MMDDVATYFSATMGAFLFPDVLPEDTSGTLGLILIFSLNSFFETLLVLQLF